MRRFLAGGMLAIFVAVASSSAAAIEVDVTLDPALDAIGQQIITVQAYTPATGGETVIDLGLYDTGASVVAFSWYGNHEFPQPHLNPGGAGGTGINGRVSGDVSQPGSILVGGLEDFGLDFDFETFEFVKTIATPPGRAVPGMQVFVGTETGSPALPTLAGTPIHGPSTLFPAGSAARITMTGIDLGAALGLGVSITLPEFELVSPGTQIAAAPGSTAPARIQLSPYGSDNRGSEGADVTVTPNPTLTNVSLARSGTSGSLTTVTAGRLLFDTGAQISLISETLAAALGLDLASPDDTIHVQGASGDPLELPGFTLNSIGISAAIDGPGYDDLLRFTDAPVFVHNLGISGLDGILGMNLFNQADTLLVDLINDELSVSFFETRPGDAFASVSTLAALFGGSPAFAGQVAPAFGLGAVVPVPEPSPIIGLAGSAAALVGLRVAFRLRLLGRGGTNLPAKHRFRRRNGAAGRR